MVAAELCAPGRCSRRSPVRRKRKSRSMSRITAELCATFLTAASAAALRCGPVSMPCFMDACRGGVLPQPRACANHSCLQTGHGHALDL